MVSVFVFPMLAQLHGCGQGSGGKKRIQGGEKLDTVVKSNQGLKPLTSVPVKIHC